jgi:NHL repeat
VSASAAITALIRWMVWTARSSRRGSITTAATTLTRPNRTDTLAQTLTEPANRLHGKKNTDPLKPGHGWTCKRFYDVFISTTAGISRLTNGGDTMRRRLVAKLLFAIAMGAGIPAVVHAQAVALPSIDLPNAYNEGTSFGELPDGRAWGGTTAVAVDGDGKSVWVFERCGAESCANSTLPPVLHFDPAGTLMASFGAGMFVFPHGIATDPEGNVWVADGDGVNGKGQQVVKFSASGKVLLTLGKAGMPGNEPGFFNKPSGVAIARNGDIFVANGHGGDSNARVVKFSKDGQFITAWGRKGSAAGEFDVPHAVAVDSQERVYVADRSNSRVQVFDAKANSSPTGGNSAGQAGFISTRTI